ncbi:helix-turn-helix domain-containing protein [Pseudomonas rubra]|uniref:Helix-turn-helix domain containing protein n=1 Tax=Pseudomonas rubra TaxID=2942627 RepID=A0ABT5P1I4_9PSED|nr:helix-turn-helix domain-containing protein [Pseudomonas rubra]MDD1012134.1 helix-turn-helix domain containing protein [Pseudomonas rubra]MDD1038430.1 helix-turn-helix domain containing protein [Pseudomonas rubra]MDD1153467.1 helix-turn-helix domain containing protein [Pseudomonas rubra]
MSNQDFAAVLSRLKLITAASTDSGLSHALGVSPQTLSSWKGRNSIPYAICIDIAARSGICLDWLLLGEGPQRRPPATDQPSQDLETQLLAQLRSLSAADLQVIALMIEEKQRLRVLEDKLEQLCGLIVPAAQTP